MSWMRRVSREMGFVFLRFSAFHMFKHGTVILDEFKEWHVLPLTSWFCRVSSRTTLRVTSTRTCEPHVHHTRASVHTCMWERVCQESVRGVRAVCRAGGSCRGRIDIKIVTEFRRAATYPNALSSPLNYPFSSRVLLFPSSRRSLKSRSHFMPLSGLFSETCACFAL